MKTVTAEWNMTCPECGRDDHLVVSVLVDALLTVDGTDTDKPDCHDHVWDEDSVCICGECGYASTARYFDIASRKL